MKFSQSLAFNFKLPATQGLPHFKTLSEDTAISVEHGEWMIRAHANALVFALVQSTISEFLEIKFASFDWLK